eukprot:m.216888 g.216888  ORF g.216888 m.216888 type:complete len:215 (+) comp15550_c0_seq1:66-710(+)
MATREPEFAPDEDELSLPTDFPLYDPTETPAFSTVSTELCTDAPSPANNQKGWWPNDVRVQPCDTFREAAATISFVAQRCPAVTRSAEYTDFETLTPSYVVPSYLPWSNSQLICAVLRANNFTCERGELGSGVSVHLAMQSSDLLRMDLDDLLKSLQAGFETVVSPEGYFEGSTEITALSMFQSNWSSFLPCPEFNVKGRALEILHEPIAMNGL